MTLNFLRKTFSTYLEIIIFSNLNYKDQTCQNIFGTKFQNPTLNDEIFLHPIPLLENLIFENSTF